MLRIRVSTPLRPSEDPAKVERAVRAILPDAPTLIAGGMMSAEGASLEGFRQLVWRQRILDATRRVLLGSLDAEGTRARFRLSKQAAFGGQVSFAIGAAPLGDLEVEVEGHDLEAVFKELAPPTLHGHPVSEEEYERSIERRRRKTRAEAPPVSDEETEEPE